MLLSHEGYIRVWDWDFTNSIKLSTLGEYMGTEGSTKGYQGWQTLSDIIACKSIFALHSAIMKTVEGEARSYCTTLYDRSCHILDSAATETHPGQCSCHFCKCWADDDGSAVPLFEYVHHKHHLVMIRVEVMT